MVLDAGRGEVDHDQAGVDLVDELEGGRERARTDGRRETESNAVGQLHRVLEVARRQHGEHGTEDLLLRHAHVGRNIGEDGWRREVAARVRAVRQPATATLQPRPFLLADADVLEHRLQLALVDRGANVDAGFEAVADLQGLRALDQRARELVDDRLFHDEARRGGAALARGKERGVDHGVHGIGDVSVAEHDPDARAVLITPSRTLAARVAREVERQMPRTGPARQSLRRHGGIIVTATTDEAIQLANATAYGLSSGVCTNRLDWITRFVNELQAGTVNVREVPGYRLEMTPFGGIKDSGLGYKEGVLEAMKSFTNVKTYSLPWE